MFYGTDEQRIEKIKNHIEELRGLAALYPAVKKVIDAFNGKVYNKRFSEALKKEFTDIAYIYADKRYNRTEIYASLKNTKSEFRTLASIRIEELVNGKRIPADLLSESLRLHRENYLKEALALESTLPKVNEIVSQLKQLTDTYRSIYGAIHNFEIVDESDIYIDLDTENNTYHYSDLEFID